MSTLKAYRVVYNVLKPSTYVFDTFRLDKIMVARYPEEILNTLRKRGDELISVLLIGDAEVIIDG